MSFSSTFLKHPRTQATLSRLLASYLRLVYATSRIRRHIHAEAAEYIQGEQNGIFAFWHGRMMLLPAFCPPQRKMHVLISHHRDGLLISQVIGHFGQSTVSGSSSRGGSAAVSEMLSLLKAGDNISITPDGPRGPSQIATVGVVTVARLSGKPILPVTFAARPAKRFASWDRFMLALPFGRIAFCIGRPIMVSEDADEETMRRQYEQAMNKLVEEADGAISG